MNNLLTYHDICWNKYLFLFNKINNLQVIFLIPKSEEKHCLFLGKINNMNLYEISGIKIKRIKNIGPFITLKNLTTNFDGINIESSVLKFYENNKYLKWIAISDDVNLELPNTFSILIDNYDINYSLSFIIPHRNRKVQLNKTLEEINKYVKFKNMDADIWVIEQSEFGDWNKGCTLNIGFKVLMDFYQYFVFNDCDTYLELFTNFIFPKQNEILHLFGYDYCLGGIFSCCKETFSKLDGFNNNFFNWGREDRDLEDRCKSKNIKINREYLIKLNDNGVKQIQHDNSKNYWNFKIKNTDFFVSRQSYYNNQITHYLKLKSGLQNLKNGYIGKNRKFIILINLIKWTNGTIKLKDKDIFLNIKIESNTDTGIINFNELILPINPEEKFPKILIEIYENSINFKLNYFIEDNIKIESNVKKINIDYKNIDLDYESIYTSFKYDTINYQFTEVLKENHYMLNVSF